MNKKLLILELNEFNTDLLRRGSEHLNLSNIKRMLTMSHAETFTDNFDHGELDPWVQWVSVHIGLPHKIHKVTRLGELPNPNYPQLWEKLSKKNVTSGIWGPMNASRNNSKNCKFFLPDPWSFSELGFPSSLNRFLSLPRYYAKNYISPSLIKLIIAISKTIRFFIYREMINILKNEFLNSIKIIKKYGINNIVLFCLFDIYSAKVFLKFKQKYNPDFSILFLNSLAHLQHHKWDVDKINQSMKLCLITIDRILGFLFNQLDENESIIIMNALSQRNVKGENKFIYRQKKPSDFLNLLNINFKKIEQGMTNDAHVFFETKKDRDIAYSHLKNVKIGNEDLLYVELKETNKLFYQIEYCFEVEKMTKFNIGNNYYDFYKHFTLLVEQTGSHIQKGDIFYEGISLDKKIYNHEFHDFILTYFLS